RFQWNREALNRARDYTVRSVDAESRSFTVDVVRHETGLASDWAFGVAIGDRISFAGPKTCAGLAEGIDFHLLVADETALPAVGGWRKRRRAPAATSSSSSPPPMTSRTSPPRPTSRSTGSSAAPSPRASRG